MERAELLERLEREFASREDGEVAVWLFGSRARDEALPQSDVAPPLLRHRMKIVEDGIAALRSRAELDALEVDLVQRGFVERTLQLVVQAVIDVASHVVAIERLGVPESNRDLFRHLAEHGWLEAGLADELAKASALRDILVHQYVAVDLDELRHVVRERLDDLLVFCDRIRSRLDD